MLISDSINVDLFMQPAQYGISYFVAFTIINVIQTVMLIYFGGNQTALANTSEWLLLQSCLFLAFESVYLFKIALGYYDTKLFWLFISFVTNISVMMLVLWRFTAVIQKFRNKLLFLMAIIFSIVYFTMTYYYYADGLFWVIESMLFLWQISYSVQRGGTGGVSFELVLVILLSRTPLLLIMKSQQNILRIKPDLLAFRFILISIAIHLLIIWCQKKFGSRFFLPVKLIPNYFNYIRQDTFGSEIAASECSICLNRLREKPNSVAKPQEQTQSEVNEKKNEKITYVYTKCKHYYHQSCLQDWLKVHLVCPLCKSDLPPMQLGSA